MTCDLYISGPNSPPKLSPGCSEPWGYEQRRDASAGMLPTSRLQRSCLPTARTSRSASLHRSHRGRRQVRRGSGGDSPATLAAPRLARARAVLPPFTDPGSDGELEVFINGSRDKLDQG